MLETKCRHLACNQIKIINKNAGKMAAKMTFITKYKKIFHKTGKLQGFACKILLILDLQKLSF